MQQKHTFTLSWALVFFTYAVPYLISRWAVNVDFMIEKVQLPVLLVICFGAIALLWLNYKGVYSSWGSRILFGIGVLGLLYSVGILFLIWSFRSGVGF